MNRVKAAWEVRICGRGIEDQSFPAARGVTMVAALKEVKGKIEKMIQEAK
jgi:hypothetical protein